VDVEHGYALGKFGSERIPEVIVVGRDAGADRGSPTIAAIQTSVEVETRSECCRFSIIALMIERA